MTTYIPFSQRQSLPYEQLGSIADYLERILGWDLEYQFKNNYHYFTDGKWEGYKCLLGFTDYENDISKLKAYFLWENGSKAMFDHMPFNVFYSTYQALLPAIRNELWYTN